MLAFYLSLLATKEEQDKFTQLYEKYKKLLMKKAMERLGNFHMAQDALQETFIKIVLCIDSIEDVNSPRTANYVVTILENTITDMYRKDKHEPKDSFEELTEVSGNGIDLLDRLLAEDIADMIGELPEKYRAVMELRVYYEMELKQIADVLGISYATVRKRLERARAMLVEKMAQKEAEYCER